MRAKLFYAMLGLLVGVAAILFLRPKPLPKAMPAEGPFAAELALERPVPEVFFEGMPFITAIERMRALTGIPIDVDRGALEKDGIDCNTPVTIQCRNRSLADVLDEMCRRISTPTVLPYADALRDSVLITTANSRNIQAIVRTYDVRDLIGDDVPAPAYGGPSRADDLMRLIADTVSPASWKSYGGMYGGMNCFSGKLVVSQTLENHWRLRALLAQLRDPQRNYEPPTPAPDLYAWDTSLREWVSRNTEVGDAALRRPVDELKFEAKSFQRAVEIVRKQAGVQLILRVADLAEKGIDVDSRVTLEMPKSTAAEALNALLQSHPAGDEIDFSPDGGVIVVSTRAKVAEFSFPRVYDVRDWPTGHVAPVRAPKIPNFDSMVIVESYGPPATVPSSPAPPLRTRRDELEELTKIVMNSVVPESWRDNGGAAGTIKATDDALVITQTWRNQEKVRSLLNALRAGVVPPGLHRRADTIPAE